MKKKFLVCIDSDGCAMDVMEIKHKECFCPAYINCFGLQPVSTYARETWEFANLYSRWRGVNRFLVLLKALELLSERKEVQERNFEIPMLKEFRKYVDSGGALNISGIKGYLNANPDSEEIKKVLEWSDDVNKRVGEMVHGVSPFPYVHESLKQVRESADIIIVSAAQQAIIEHEWSESNLMPFVTSVRGQEHGAKKEIIASLCDQYEPQHILMVGDALGDLDAAHSNNVLFYPICPQQEAWSWKYFSEVAEAFLSGNYSGQMEQEKIEYFESLLPKEPSWERIVK